MIRRADSRVSEPPSSVHNDRVKRERNAAAGRTELDEVWAALPPERRVDGFRELPPAQREDLFLELASEDQAELILALPDAERRSWMRLLPPDDAADAVQSAPDEERGVLLALLDEQARREVIGLLRYAEDDAGGLMNPRFARVRPEMSVEEAIAYLRRQTRESAETIYYLYVLSPDQTLLGVVSFRDLFRARSGERIENVMRRNPVSVTEEMDQEHVALLFRQERLDAIPVVDAEHRMKGIVTVDDIVTVVEEEATEDIQKLGGMEALEAPYLSIGLGEMVKKRGGWLAALFLGEMLTATAMAHYEGEIARAVVLTLFIPLIISSGGNSGSQATTLVIRAMALGEIRLRDWWRVMRREVLAGLGLGALLAVIGIVRIFAWQAVFGSYGVHTALIAATVGISLLGVVLFGTIAGSMLPFLLRRVGLDPASASAPFVATLVDVSGLVIYFSAASMILAGTLL